MVSLISREGVPWRWMVVDVDVDVELRGCECVSVGELLIARSRSPSLLGMARLI